MTTPLIQIAGHRGMGCTDSDHARDLGKHLSHPLENTLESFRVAYGLADLVETDVVLTLDAEPVLIHSPDINEHIQPAFRPAGAKRIDLMTLEQALKLRLGAEGNVPIPTLRQLLQLILELRPGDDLILNLELKDIGDLSLVQHVLRIIQEMNFPLQRIRFSSFALDLMEELILRAPHVRAGILLSHDQFTLPILRDVLEKIPTLEAVHTEIRSLTDETVAYIAEKKLSIATWAWQEESPLHNAAFAEASKNAITLCMRYQVPLIIITDYVEDMCKYLDAIK